MPARNQCSGVSLRGRSFNEQVKGLANYAISRRQLLKLCGAAILSTTLVPLFPKRAFAQSVENRWRLSDIRYVPTSTQRICQMTGDYDPQGLPHINYTGQWGIEGTDLGISVEYQGKLFIFFGDVLSADCADPIAYTTAIDPEPYGFQLQPILQNGSCSSFRLLSVKGLP